MAAELSMLNREQETERRQEWEEMQRRGHLRYTLTNALQWTGGIAIAQTVWDYLCKIGLMHTYTSGSSVEHILIFGIIAGVVASELLWSDMKRKFKIPPAEEDWMAR